ncbi:MAG TPA: coenzyme F420-0:L-glutamate ligase, partial [Candidatus Paceibacterota bacterium]|nr:coenzyme F420-0:L-glutamate ligase [Candidatus Paceibacterota bacterium]
HAFIGAAGIDESNGDGHYILLPKDIFASAQQLYNWLKEKFQLQELGVVVVDSRSSPFRFGATGVALSWWGIEPIEDCRGRSDLFGRSIQHERSNLVDGLASAATVLMGEVDECTPVVIARDIPPLLYKDADTRDQLLVPFAEDTFRVLYEQYLESLD